MKCELNELVKDEILFPFMVKVNRDSYSRRTKMGKRDSYSRTEGVSYYGSWEYMYTLSIRHYLSLTRVLKNMK